VARLRAVEQDLRSLLTLEPLRPRIERLRCFRGIDDLTALAIAAELGDPRRFGSAPCTMAFVEPVPSEHSSGTKQARGAITKPGMRIYGASWSKRRGTIGIDLFVGDALRRRQTGAPAATSRTPGPRSSACIGAITDWPRAGSPPSR
jgi:hypothetical protein